MLSALRYMKSLMIHVSQGENNATSEKALCSADGHHSEFSEIRIDGPGSSDGLALSI